MELIAVRRNIQANAIFYKQIADSVFYSLDKVTWYFAFTFPTSASESTRLTFEKNIRNFYLNRDVNLILNPPGDPPPTTRGGIIENVEKVEKRRVSNRAICAAANTLLVTLRESGRLARDEEITALQTVAQNASLIVGAVGALIGVVVSGGLGIAIVGGAVATRIGADGLYPLALEAVPDLTDAQIEDAVCIIYEAAKDGQFNYADIQALDPIPGLTWSDIYTPELHSAFVTMIEEQTERQDPCPCETCYEFYPTETDITRGAVIENSLLTVDTIVSGSLREMQAILTVPLPETLILTKVSVWYACKFYENISTLTPYIRFEAPGSGGGNTAITDGLARIEIPPAQFPLVGTNELTLRLISSTCSACTSGQLATFAESFGIFLYIEVCGNPA